jgi:NO-binding membrane sensor protein with MHYT domain
MSFTSKSGQHEDGVRVTYDVGFTVLSIFTSVAGCITTLELLHRRTSTKGLFNWYVAVTSKPCHR